MNLLFFHNRAGHKIGTKEKFQDNPTQETFAQSSQDCTAKCGISQTKMREDALSQESRQATTANGARLLHATEGERARRYITAPRGSSGKESPLARESFFEHGTQSIPLIWSMPPEMRGIRMAIFLGAAFSADLV